MVKNATSSAKGSQPTSKKRKSSHELFKINRKSKGALEIFDEEDKIFCDVNSDKVQKKKTSKESSAPDSKSLIANTKFASKSKKAPVVTIVDTE